MVIGGYGWLYMVIQGYLAVIYFLHTVDCKENFPASSRTIHEASLGASFAMSTRVGAHARAPFAKRSYPYTAMWYSSVRLELAKR